MPVELCMPCLRGVTLTANIGKENSAACTGGLPQRCSASGPPWRPPRQGQRAVYLLHAGAINFSQQG
jgi:hypothetical protein